MVDTVEQASERAVTTATPTPRGATFLFVAIASVTIAIIWYFSINNHVERLATNETNGSAQFARAFGDFYRNLVTASEVMVSSHKVEFFNLTGDEEADAAQAGHISEILSLIALLCEADEVCISDDAGKGMFHSGHSQLSGHMDYLLSANYSQDHVLAAGSHFFIDEESGLPFIVVTPLAIQTRDKKFIGWLNMMFRMDRLAVRLGLDAILTDGVALLSDDGTVVWSTFTLPPSPRFYTRARSANQSNAGGKNPSSPPHLNTFEYGGNEYHFAPLPGNDLLVLSPIPVYRNGSLWIGAGLTAIILALLASLSRALTVRVRSQEEKERLRYSVEEMEKAKREAESANISKSDFLASMSHEIRTLMNGIIGMVSLLSRTPLSEEQQEYNDIIKTSASSLLIIINDILDFTKIEAGKMMLEKAPFDLQATTAECLRLLSSRAEERGNELIFEFANNIPTHVIGDIIRVRQIVLNIVSNAVKFTHNGTICVSINGAPAIGDTPATRYRIDVRDTGIGIDPCMRERIFERYEQAESTTARRFGGTGLGLAICKSLTSLMEGRLFCTSVLGEGSTFSIILTLPNNQPPADQAMVNKEWNNYPAIIYDPVPELAEMLAGLAASLGFKPVQVDTPAAVLGTLADLERHGSAIRPLVVLPHNNVENGVDMAEMVRSSPGGFGSVIFLTAYPNASESIAREKQGLYYNVVLIKPIWRVQFQQAIEQCYRTGGMRKSTSTSRSHPVVDEHGVGVGVRVLIAEDNLVNQKVAQGILRKFGYSIEVVSNGADALEILDKAKFDVILMDCQMPVLDGFETTRRIRELEHERGGTEHIVIIALTASALTTDKESCLRAGMDSHVAKPISPSELVKTIQKFTGRPNETRIYPL